MSYEEAVKAVEDIQKFYRTHDVISRVGPSSPENSDYDYSPRCIWGAAAYTGHAQFNGTYGKSMLPELREALEATMEPYDTGYRTVKPKSIGGYNDGYIMEIWNQQTRKRRMRGWLTRAKKYLKERS